jgi:hypothetical protein
LSDIEDPLLEEKILKNFTKIWTNQANEGKIQNYSMKLLSLLVDNNPEKLEALINLMLLNMSHNPSLTENYLKLILRLKLENTSSNLLFRCVDQLLNFASKSHEAIVNYHENLLIFFSTAYQSPEIEPLRSEIFSFVLLILILMFLVL